MIEAVSLDLTLSSEDEPSSPTPQVPSRPQPEIREMIPNFPAAEAAGEVPGKGVLRSPPRGPIRPVSSSRQMDMSDPICRRRPPRKRPDVLA